MSYRCKTIDVDNMQEIIKYVVEVIHHKHVFPPAKWEKNYPSGWIEKNTGIVLDHEDCWVDHSVFWRFLFGQI